MRTLFLIRHAAVEGGERLNGWSDPSLSPEGRRQALLLAERAKEWRPDRIVGSDLCRVKETAEPLARMSELTLSAHPDWRERHFGFWDGLTWSEIEARDPELARAYLHDWAATTPPGGETFAQMASRVEKAWRVVWETPWERLVLIGHRGPNGVILCRALGMPLKNQSRFTQDHASFSRIDFHRTMPVLRTFNHSTS